MIYTCVLDRGSKEPPAPGLGEVLCSPDIGSNDYSLEYSGNLGGAADD